MISAGLGKGKSDKVSSYIDLLWTPRSYSIPLNWPQSTDVENSHNDKASKPQYHSATVPRSNITEDGAVYKASA